ncbi:hypothetical protein A3Q56_03528 [Intoshia linei]|uniref:Uncharacterized protein n=1 Tax=Intoshia linei TaxID=1819745 RepID=A0A177B367_9BILA|nr:hypothetical protein A3Q56_03528 [Intoshia linei]
MEEYYQKGMCPKKMQLKEKITNSFEEISSVNCDSFYRKMLPYLIKCERHEIIND